MLNSKPEFTNSSETVHALITCKITWNAIQELQDIIVIFFFQEEFGVTQCPPMRKIHPNFLKLLQLFAHDVIIRNQDLRLLHIFHSSIKTLVIGMFNSSPEI